MANKSMLQQSSILPPLQADDFLPPVGRWTRIGGGLLVSVLIGTVGLAAIVQYNVTIQAPAIVRPASASSVVQVVKGGTIRRILVQENQTIRQGEIIAELDVSDRTQLTTLQTRRQRLEQYLQQYQTQLQQLDSELQRLDAQIVTRSGIVPTAALPQLNERSPSPTSDVLVQAALGQITTQDAAAALQLSGRRDRLLQQRLGLTNQLRYDQSTLQRLDEELSKQVVLAPTDGTVFKLAFYNVGQTVKPGTVLAQIVPQKAPLTFKARVAVQDISQVAVGHSAQLRISAYPYPDYGILSGTVQTIAPDATTNADERTGMTAAYYEVTIQPDRAYLAKGDRQYPLQPGMEARADIISREETVLQAFLRRFRLWTDL